MNADRLLPRIASAFVLILLWTSSSCAPTVSPTLFRPPSGLASPTPPPPTLQADTATPVPLPTLPPTPTLEPSPIPPCADGLTWLSDPTYEDDTAVSPGQSIDKQWLVKNSGGCDWDARYKLRNINGETLGAPAEIPLYPARAGAQVTLRIVFVAPSAEGTYKSEWQAVNPEGELFGDTVYIQIVVSP
ncbi:MAG: hypothetical protein JETCAE02_14100 [Anaerolineaceae bacterium]|nr:hypothetical protein [Anaerolineae bacterium]MBL1172417.1 hypothetical protein [Chloroflexota bacterium]MDL1925016.1 hypothetical protein [Anaerolineae bacterium AMX1]WKZ50555.1 MAG: NBR1-Ig-like domain-containing protein [Anaerolineales bacterium]GJQ38998.1 MAG: hypothetical protein JETCAE02_14100 [Anaerolineaceae bacterium]